MKKLLLLLIVFLFACEPPFTDYYTRSFVMSYCRTDKVILECTNNLFTVRFISGYKCKITDKGQQKQDYDLLCEKHGDVTYNRIVTLPTNLLEARCSQDFVSLDVYSSSNWDNNHPAGTSLGDIFRFESNTPLPFIRSGYTQLAEGGGEYHLVRCLVSELQPEDMMLLPTLGFNLRLLQPPTLSRRHTLEVRLISDEGEVFTDRITIEFR